MHFQSWESYHLYPRHLSQRSLICQSGLIGPAKWMVLSRRSGRLMMVCTVSCQHSSLHDCLQSRLDRLMQTLKLVVVIVSPVRSCLAFYFSHCASSHTIVQLAWLDIESNMSSSCHLISPQTLNQLLILKLISILSSNNHYIHPLKRMQDAYTFSFQDRIVWSFFPSSGSISFHGAGLKFTLCLRHLILFHWRRKMSFIWSMI